MFLIKHGDTYITSYALAGIEKNGYDIRLLKTDCRNIIVKRLNFDADEIQKMEYIIECIAEAIADMVVQKARIASDAILDIDEVIEIAEEEFDAGKEKDADK